MAVKRCESSIDVVKAAEIRITNVFNNGLPVYMSFSGGKDSLCMAQLIYNLVQRGKINPSQLVVQFIDEEAIFPCIEETVKTWRKRFLLMGARFEWYCLEVKHYNCFNELSNDETFICWDHTKENVWVRRPPAFAIRNHPLLRPRIDAYQDFLPRTCQSGITITGIRTAESVQRLQNIASMIKAGKTMTNKHQVFPIYDWTNNDVFQPERTSLAWVINNKLLNGYGFKHVEARFDEPDITNPDDIQKILNITERAGGLTPNLAKEYTYEVLGKDGCADYDGKWGDVPLAYSRTVTQNQLQANLGAGAGEQLQTTGNEPTGQNTKPQGNEKTVTEEELAILDGQIKKAELNDAELVPIMKEIRNASQYSL